MKARMLSGKKVHYSVAEKQQILQKKQEIRNKFEMQNLGDFKLVYPPQQPKQLEYYQTLIKQATYNWEELTTGRKRNPPTKFVIQSEKLSTVKKQKSFIKRHGS